METGCDHSGNVGCCGGGGGGGCAKNEATFRKVNQGYEHVVDCGVLGCLGEGGVFVRECKGEEAVYMCASHMRSLFPGCVLPGDPAATACPEPCPATCPVPSPADVVAAIATGVESGWHTGEINMYSMQPQIDKVLENIHRECLRNMLMGKLEAYAHLYGTICGKAGALFNEGEDKCANEFRVQARVIKHLMNQTKGELESSRKDLTSSPLSGKDIPV